MFNFNLFFSIKKVFLYFFSIEVLVFSVRTSCDYFNPTHLEVFCGNTVVQCVSPFVSLQV